jgi:iron-regulated transporter 1
VRSILSRQESLVDLEEEQRDFGREIGVLEPRPVVFWQGLEERMGF